MATLYFKSLDKSDKAKIPFSVGETVIGRGPLLEIADKRVSRSHAVINVGKNGCSVTPKSLNPFFFTETDGGEKIILPKDEKKELKNGNSVGLLPDIFWFKIVISDSVNGTSKEDKDEDSVEEIQRKKAKAPTVTPPGKKEMALPLDKKRKLPDWMYQSANVAPPVKKKSPAKKVQPVASRQKGKISPLMASASRKCKTDKLLIAAIDFGTTYSGYAYGFISDLEKIPPYIIRNNWSWKGGAQPSQKAPTSVLFNPKKKFHSFGFEAENKYAQLSESYKHKNWYFFKRFKMMLQSTSNLQRSSKLEDILGKPMDAMTVFSAAIEYLKNHLMTSIHERVSQMTENDVYWVLTVPAIWDDKAKQFMREAASMAGIENDQLCVALEPEAASVYCQLVPAEKITSLDGTCCLSDAKEGTKVMILDIGGGTADITVHQREANDQLKEVFKASGGPWGGTAVDREIESFLVSIMGADILYKFKDLYTEDYTNFWQEVEVRKREVKKSSNSKLSLKIPVSLAEMFQEYTGASLIEVIKMSKHSSNITWTADKMRLDPTLATDFFKPAIQSIVSHVKDLFCDPAVRDTDMILMVGGFAASPLLQDELRRAFPSKKLFIPNLPDLAVVIGAVMFGYQPTKITQRCIRYTYGIETCKPFVKGEHPKSKEKIYDGEAFCIDKFAKYVGVGDTLKLGESTPSHIHSPVMDEQTGMDLNIYMSSQKNPSYIDDTDTSKLGHLFVDMPDTEGGKERRVEIRMVLGGTELEVEATELKTKKQYKAKFDFLG